MSDTVRSKPAKRGTRNSLSCSQCRYKHIRCDGRKPVCSRCATNAVQCVYPISRRRGNPKSGKAPLSPVRDVYETSIASSLQTSAGGSSSSVTLDGEIESSSNSAFSFLSLYYEFFHAAHPCALPFKYFKTRLDEAKIKPLLQVMCYVGSFFDTSCPCHILDSWAKRAQDSMVEIRSSIRPLTPFDIQAVLLYSIAVYWCNETENGVELLDEAIRMAVSLGMNKKEFARNYAEGDSILEESWRRTWWVIYITDAHIAGMPTELIIAPMLHF